MRTVFELKILHRQNEQTCIFLLLWDDRTKQLNASLPYSQDVQKWYQRWRQWYYRFYQLSAPQSPSNSGRLNPGSGDLAHDLMEAERELVQAFQRWLGAGELRAVQQQIRDEVVRLTQVNPDSAQKTTDTQPGVDIFLACESNELARLPWEVWSLAWDVAPPGALRIVRTAMDTPDNHPTVQLHRRKPRILAVLGNDPSLPLQADWKAMRSLAAIADIKRFHWLPDDSASTIKQKMAATIGDRQGWDVLFFAGHSDETAVTGGRLAIAPNVSVAISEIEDYLTQARQQGLKLAIFNSCSGLSIANSLVAIGLQVVVMREQIRNDVAQSFLKPLCQQLAQHRNIQDALLSASQHLQSAEKFAYPSAHLIPSFFSPYGTAAYRIPRFGWQRQLQSWLPTKREAIALTTVTLIGWMVPVQDMLLDLRTAAQASYRDLTNQIPSEPPPVTLIAIDQTSLNRADETIEEFKIQPIDRQYLSTLIEQLAKANAKVVGIDYFLDTEEPKEDLLADAIRRTVQTKNTWFIFVSRDRDQRWPRDEIADPAWSLEADAYFYQGRVKLPKERVCTAAACPFAYTLALAGTLTQEPSLNNGPQPALQNNIRFQEKLSLYLRQADLPTLQPFFDQAIPPRALPYITDFSIPPSRIYQRVPAWQFLSNSTAFNDLSETVVIVASDRYTEARDQFSSPTAFTYWCRSRYPSGLNPENCPRDVTGGEHQAYMTHHFLRSHLIVLIPDWWLIWLSALFAKGVGLYLVKRPARQNQQIFSVLTGIVGYGVFVLQIYISALVLIPILLPSLIFLLYIIPIIKETPDQPPTLDITA